VPAFSGGARPANCTPTSRTRKQTTVTPPAAANGSQRDRVVWDGIPVPIIKYFTNDVA
jgi:hypothetical protein